jgi:hypothetical protein
MQAESFLGQLVRSLSRSTPAFRREASPSTGLSGRVIVAVRRTSPAFTEPGDMHEGFPPRHTTSIEAVKSAIEHPEQKSTCAVEGIVNSSELTSPTGSPAEAKPSRHEPHLQRSGMAEAAVGDGHPTSATQPVEPFTRCSTCGAPSTAGSSYCMRCGHRTSLDAGAVRSGRPTSIASTKRCPRCQRPNEVNLKVCAYCGSSLCGPLTRYLCAAVHLDAAFADEVLSEYVIEKIRQIPPAPGINSAAVFRDAIAAHARRRIRDAVLIALLALLTLIAPGMLIEWLLVALLTAAFLRGRTNNGGTGRNGSKIAAAPLAVGALLLLGLTILQPLLAIGLIYGLYPVAISGATIAAAAICGIISLILLGDEFIVHKLVHEKFSPACFREQADHSDDWESWMRTLGIRTYSSELARAAASEKVDGYDQVDIVAFGGGSSPFVGSGEIYDRRSVTLSLTPAEQDSVAGIPLSIDINMLQQRIADGILALRQSATDQSLRSLEAREQVLVSMEGLLAARSS